MVTPSTSVAPRRPQRVNMLVSYSSLKCRSFFYYWNSVPALLHNGASPMPAYGDNGAI